jgi:hypothetical protein
MKNFWDVEQTRSSETSIYNEPAWRHIAEGSILQNSPYTASLLTNSMELSPSRKTASCQAIHTLLNMLWNPNVHYRIHKSSPFVPILSNINSFHTTPSHLSKSFLILSTHLRLSFLSCYFPVNFPSNNAYGSSFPLFVLHALSISSSLI